MAIWDFTMSEEDRKAIDALDLGHSEIIDRIDQRLHGEAASIAGLWNWSMTTVSTGNV